MHTRVGVVQGGCALTLCAGVVREGCARGLCAGLVRRACAQALCCMGRQARVHSLGLCIMVVHRLVRNGCAHVVRRLDAKPCAPRTAQGFTLVCTSTFRAAQGLEPCANFISLIFFFIKYSKTI